jgi:signal peptidase I
MDDQHEPATLPSTRFSESAGPTDPAADPAPPSSSGRSGPDLADNRPTRGSRVPGRHASGRRKSRRAADEAAPEQDKNAPAGKKRKNFWRELLVIVVAAAALTLLLKAFVVQVYRIPSASMENTLQVNDRVLVNKLIYHFRSIDRGDIVVFSGQNSWGPNAPPPSSDPVVRLWDDVLSAVGLHSSQTYYIKRVIGLPGDRVACCTDGKVTVNGVPLTETSYVYPGDKPSSFTFSVTVPPGHIWVMGDHRADSDDSRYHGRDPGGGAVPENEVVGRAFLIIWPPSQTSDLPIPSTFQQAALHARAAALTAAAAVPVAGTAVAAGVIGVPLLMLRRRARRSGHDEPSRPQP